MRNEILWEETSSAPLNIWGLDFNGGRFRHSFANHRHNASTQVGPLGLIAWTLIFTSPFIFGAWNSNIYLGIALLSMVISFLFYYLVIREVKYYQIAKKTKYQITNQDIIINYTFLGIKKVLKIPIREIENLHLVEYDYKENNGLKGSIWIYHQAEVKAYDSLKKERSNIPRIQIVKGYKDALHILKNRMQQVRNET